MIPIIAQVDSSWIAPIANFGAIGVMLVWLMKDVRAELRSIGVAVNRMTRATMLTLATMDQATEGIRNQARGIVEEIDKEREENGSR